MIGLSCDANDRREYDSWLWCVRDRRHRSTRCQTYTHPASGFDEITSWRRLWWCLRPAATNASNIRKDFREEFYRFFVSFARQERNHMKSSRCCSGRRPWRHRGWQNSFWISQHHHHRCGGPLEHAMHARNKRVRATQPSKIDEWAQNSQCHGSSSARGTLWVCVIDGDSRCQIDILYLP